MVAETERKLNTLSQIGEYTRFADFLTEVVNLTDICECDDASRVSIMEDLISGNM
jgi:DNA-binding transcriptional regulator/RsmH inhibitor MraZ